MTDQNTNPDEQDANKSEPLGTPGLEALRKEREAREAAEKRLRELEAAQKARDDAELTEVERLNRQVEELTTARATAAAEAEQERLQTLRYQVATEKGIPAQWVGRLQGTDRETLEADADALIPSLRLDVNPTPKADPSQGAAHNTNKKSTQDQFAELVDF